MAKGKGKGRQQGKKKKGSGKTNPSPRSTHSVPSFASITNNGRASKTAVDSDSPALPQSLVDHAPESYKQAGNDAYCQFNFEKAEELYTQGLAICPDGNSADRRLRAVLFSNRANARFEQGNYEGSIQDSRDSLHLLMKSFPPPQQSCSDLGRNEDNSLISKNRWRLARALFYGSVGLDGSRDSSLQDLKELAQECREDPELSAKIENLSQAKESAVSFQSSNLYVTASEPFSPQFVRSSFMSPYGELTPFGNDDATTALGLDWDEVCDEKKRVDRDALFSKDVLLGGVGDARHVMATIIHANGCRHTPYLRITMNDISCCTMLKDVVVLTLSHRIGKMAPNARLAMEEKEPNLLLAVIYYVSLGYAMPEVVYEKFQSFIRTTFLEKSRDDFIAEYPWMVIHQGDWESLAETAMFWVDTSRYDPPLPSVSEALCLLKSSGGMIDMSSLPGSCVMADNERKQKEEKAEFFRQEREKYSSIENYSSEEIANLQEASGKKYLSDEEIIQLMMTVIDYNEKQDHVGYDPRNDSALRWDKHYSRATGGALMPPLISGLSVEDCLDPEAFLFPHPNDLDDMLDPEGPLYHSHKNVDLNESIARVRCHVRRNWKTNPAKFDPNWPSSEDHTDYTVEWIQNYFKKNLVESFHDDLEENQVVDMLFVGVLFQHIAYFYWNLGKAIQDLTSKNLLLVEVNCGCILDCCAQVVVNAEAREESGLPTKYSTALMSNIADYNGLLSNFLELHPVLSPGGIIYNNVLKNTGLFKDYDEYLVGTMALNVDDMKKILGIVSVREHPDVWNHFNKWRFIYRNPTCASPAEVKTWLHRLFLTTVFPPQRDTLARVREERPNTVDLFLRTCAFCIDTLGYPEHWIMGVIDDLLGSELKTKASLLFGSPTQFKPEKSLNCYNISASHLELQNRLSYWIGSGKLPPSLVKCDVLPKGKTSKFQLNLVTRVEDTFGGDAPILGLLLEKNFDPQFNQNSSFGNFENFLSMMSGHPYYSATGEANLRSALLERGSTGHIFLLSCVQFDVRDDSITFFMSEDSFEKYSSYYVSIIRTDGWFRLPWSRHVLSKCNRV